MSLVTTRKGDALLAFESGEIPEAARAIPLPLALVIARHQGKTLFVFNQWRQVWELPGGMIDADEAPHETAIRELAEESGQQVTSVEYVGWMKFRLKPDDRLELGVLYRCELETLQPFETNDEIARIMLWDMQTAVEHQVSEIDLYLARLVNHEFNP